MIILLPFSILSAAMFAVPSVTQIEEVIGLIHGTAADYQALYILLTVTAGTLTVTLLSILEKPSSRRGLRLNARAPRLVGRCAQSQLGRYLQPCVYPAIEINRLSLPPYRRR
ncbi:hypothetical protein BH20ACI3_BH20ACI3_16960 [soil metagenome]